MIPTLQKDDWFHPDGFPIAVERRTPQQPFGLHAHEFSEIVIITSGCGLHVTGEDSWRLSPGDAFVIGGSRPHDYQNLEELQLVNVLYDRQDLGLALKDLPSLPGFHALFRLEPAWRKRHQFNSRLRLSPQDLEESLCIIDQLDAELNARRAGFGFLATALFMQLVAFLSRRYSRAKNPDSLALLRIAETITHLESHYTNDVRLADLVAMAGMSKRSFLRAFADATGQTPIAYLIQLRTTRAADLLRTTPRSVTEVAYEVGFNDSNYFARQFRKQFGKTPREYRKQQIR